MADVFIGKPPIPAGLPTPAKARKIARETGRLAAASDGNTYSGATVEEGKEYSERRTRAFRTLEAIQLLADIEDADAFVAGFAKHWWIDFQPSSIADAIAFLSAFKKAVEARNG